MTEEMLKYIEELHAQNQELLRLLHALDEAGLIHSMIITIVGETGSSYEEDAREAVEAALEGFEG